ncbi:unnamed protein product [Parnassius apollo]|uniref:(apollo) hypothetical protein n=1 Tax=Parnassius apollo TaxID=110799 RepID=A0A8S3YA80_PARAO|nr:unnamed protein product [Parnassius apollo]
MTKWTIKRKELRWKVYRKGKQREIEEDCGGADPKGCSANGGKTESLSSFWIGCHNLNLWCTGIAKCYTKQYFFHGIIYWYYWGCSNVTDFWGKRKDKIIDANDWIPLLEMSPKIRDAIYLTPKLSDGTEYKLIIKFGKVLNAQKIGQVLE